MLKSEERREVMQSLAGAAEIVELAQALPARHCLLCSRQHAGSRELQCAPAQTRWKLDRRVTGTEWLQCISRRARSGVQEGLSSRHTPRL